MSRTLYVSMVSIAIVMMLFTDSHLGEMFLGVALFFDPFDQKVPLNKRPLWQQVLLVTHALVVIGMIIWDIFT